MRYADNKRGQRCAMKLPKAATVTTLVGFLLAGDTRAQSSIKTLLQDELPAQAYRRALLVPGSTPSIPVVSRGKSVCNCFNVTDVAIEQHLSDSTGTAPQRLGTLQKTLNCGNNCGYCLPELQRMVRASIPKGMVVT